MNLNRLRELLFQTSTRVFDLRSGNIGKVGRVISYFSISGDTEVKVMVWIKEGFVWTRMKYLKEISPLEELARIAGDE